MISNPYSKFSRKSALGEGDSLKSLAGIPSIQPVLNSSAISIRDKQISTQEIRNSPLGQSANLITKLPTSDLLPKDAEITPQHPLVTAWYNYFMAEYRLGEATLVAQSFSNLKKFEYELASWKAYQNGMSAVFPAENSSKSPIMSAWIEIKKKHSVIQDCATSLAKYFPVEIPPIEEFMAGPPGFGQSNAKYLKGYLSSFSVIKKGSAIAENLKNKFKSFVVPKIGSGGANSDKGSDIEIKLMDARVKAIAALDTIITDLHGVIDTVNSNVQYLDKLVNVDFPKKIVSANLQKGVAEQDYQKALASLIGAASPYIGAGDKAANFDLYSGLSDPERAKKYPAVFKACQMGLIKFEGEMGKKKSDEAAAIGSKFGSIIIDINFLTGALADLDTRRTTAKEEKKKLESEYAAATSEAEKNAILEKLMALDKKISDLARDILVRGRNLDNRREEASDLALARTKLVGDSRKMRDDAMSRRAKRGIDLGSEFSKILNDTKQQNDKNDLNLASIAKAISDSGKVIEAVFSHTTFPDDLVIVAQEVHDRVKARRKFWVPEDDEKGGGGFLAIFAAVGYFLSR